MKKQLFSVATVIGFAISPVLGNAQVIVNETFESYADTTQMDVNWSAAGLGVLVTTNGNGGNSAYHPGGTVNSWIGSAFSITPSVTHNIVLTADIYDDGGSANERLTVGLRNGANPLFEMGHYNTPAGHYMIRGLSLHGTGGAWVPFAATNTPVVGWNRFQATFTATDMTITLDIGANGSIDHSLIFVGAPSANPFVDLRFGGPSNATSGGGPVWFDNIRLEMVVVPEPTVAMLGLLGGLGLVLASRRRK